MGPWRSKLSISSPAPKTPNLFKSSDLLGETKEPEEEKKKLGETSVGVWLHGKKERGEKKIPK
jgi:hypothetical protein